MHKFFKMKINLILILLLIINVNCYSQARFKHHTSKKIPFRVVGYYRGDIKDVEKFEYEKLTHLLYCFTYLQGNRIGFKNEDSKNTLKRCVELKKKYPHLKVLVSIGGWGGCETCSDVFSTEAGRKEFAISVKEMLVEYNADGIDIDWESPVIGGYKNHKASPNDKQNFTELLKELKRRLPKKFEISFDANSFREFIDLSLDWKNVMPLVDFVNLMTYGLPSDKRGHTGHHTALFSSPYQSESVDKSINYLDSLGVPLNKLVIGAAFYSFVVQNVDSVNNGLGRPGKFKSNVNYNQLIENYTNKEGFNYYWDSIAKAPYLYNSQQKIFVTFDDKSSVALKTQYAIDKNLGGLMFWKLNGDTYTNGLLDTIDKQIKINIAPCQTSINSLVKPINPSIFGWYKVIESSDINVWSIGANIQITGTSKSNSILFTGYTNVGASVTAYIKDNKIIIPHQTNTVIPFGGDGKSNFDIVAEAKGIIKSDKIILEFYKITDSVTEYKGVITALRLPAQDTTIGDCFYSYVKYNLNRNPYEIGQFYENGIKNGNWLYRDQHKRLTSNVNYINDTLNGRATYYYYRGELNYQSRKLEGLILKGKKTGIWFLKERKNIFRFWHTTAIYIYNNNEQMISKTLTYKNGKPQLQIFYSDSEKEIWYRFFKKNGEIYIDDNKNHWNYEIPISK